DAGRPNSDLEDRFLEGIVGYEPNDFHNLIFFTADLDEQGGRPGKLLKGGGVEDPNFERDFATNDVHLLDRSELRRRSFLTLNAGYRRGKVALDNPPNPPG